MKRLPETHHETMLPVEEVLVEVHERDHLLEDLQMGHANQALQHVQKINVIVLLLELHVVVLTDLGVRE